jgi:hypothetical protein
MTNGSEETVSRIARTNWLWQPDEIREYATGRTEFLACCQMDASFSEDTMEVGRRSHEKATGEVGATTDQIILGYLPYLEDIE